METIHFETLGCKLNQIETESLAHAFSEAGYAVDQKDDEKLIENSSPVETVYRPVGINPVALCVVNTCTVTGKAEQKARHLIRSLLSKYPEAPVIVTGCYAEVEGVVIASIDSRVVVFPGSRKAELAALPAWLAARALRHHEEPMLSALQDYTAHFATASRDSGTAGAAASPSSGQFSLSTDNFLFHSRASIKIQDGCNNRCSYCRIRLARGRAVSLEPSEVISRIRKIAEAGWNEVILAGVNLSQYRSEDGDFADLLARILGETDRIAIRISSLYPERIDDVILPYLANPRIRPHFHLSVQSGSDRILTAMRRPYTAETVFRAAEKLRSIRENPFLACDIITGFPGETDEDFAKTLDMCEKIGFAWIHAFPFSARPGTEAWAMKPKIAERIAGERVRALTALADSNSKSYRSYWAGRELEAIAEKSGPGEPVSAVTENYLSVLLPPGCAAPASRIVVRIEGDGSASFVRDCRA